MRKIKSNIIKGWITSIVGTVLMLTSLFLWFSGVISMMWEGVIGISLGCLLLLAPRSLERNVGRFLSAWGGGRDPDECVKPDNPDEADK